MQMSDHKELSLIERRSRDLCRRVMRGSEIQAKYGSDAWNFVGIMRKYMMQSCVVYTNLHHTYEFGSCFFLLETTVVNQQFSRSVTTARTGAGRRQAVPATVATAFCGDTRDIAEAISRSTSSSTNYHHSVALFDELASARSLFAVCPL